MPLGPSDVRTASLTALEAVMFERRTSSGLSAFLKARYVFGAVPTVADIMIEAVVDGGVIFRGYF